MCNISVFTPGVMPKKEDLWNVCYNNWHSYGIVTRVDGKLDIKRVVPESGEIDPQEVWDLLEKDVDYERFMHVRHNTAGATSAENCHPFEVFYKAGKNGRHVVFMHNGTLYQYKSKRFNAAGASEDDPDGPSDSKNFADQVLIPLLSGTNFGKGHGDIETPFVKDIIKKFWQVGSNRGLLISSDQEPLFIDDWKTIEGDGGKYQSSNDEYFKNVTRGPEHERRRLRREAEEAKAKDRPFQVDKSNQSVTVAKMSDYQFDTDQEPFKLTQSLDCLGNDFDIYDRSCAVGIGYATKDELEQLYNDKKECLYFMSYIFGDYAALYEDFLKLQEKHENASKMIATLKNKKAA